MNIFKKAWDLLHYFEWNIAIRPHFDGDFRGTDHPYKVIKNSIRYWCADPFVFSHNEKNYVFFEAFDKFNCKGLIGYREIKKNSFSKIHICLQTDHHLSYPFIFKKDGNIYLLPECFESGKLTLYRAIDFPDKWEEDSTLLSNIRVCDTNHIESDRHEYLLTTPLLQEPFVYDKLYLYTKFNGSWLPCDSNPVVCDTDKARNAGNIFSSSIGLVRPAQNCSVSYGESIVLNHITDISPTRYLEEKIDELKISEINYCGKKVFDGIHTLNVTSDYDRISEKLQLQRMFFLLKSKLKRG